MTLHVSVAVLTRSEALDPPPHGCAKGEDSEVPRRGAAVARALAAALLVSLASCGGHGPTQPTPGGNGGSNQQPPPNNVPVIDAITARGTRTNEPANFADLGETIELAAQVHDDETPADRLQYEWSATQGTFDGMGAKVTWQAPEEVATPVQVTITLKVIEKYGQPASFQHEVTGTAGVSLHDSAGGVGEMSREFLLDFSDTDAKDTDHIMRNFRQERCPNPKDVQNERSDVQNHFKNFKTVSFRIGEPNVTVNFGGVCPFRGRAGDACAALRAFWDAIDLRDQTRGAVDGTDFISAVYSSADARWWLCSSDYQGHSVSGVTLHSFLTW
jgi:hypothetical protein